VGIALDHVAILLDQCAILPNLSTTVESALTERRTSRWTLKVKDDLIIAAQEGVVMQPIR
jgi:hypothetical protein